MIRAEEENRRVGRGRGGLERRPETQVEKRFVLEINSIVAEIIFKLSEGFKDEFPYRYNSA